MLRIEVFNTPRKFLNSLERKRLRQISGKIQMLAQNPLPPDSQQMKGKSAAFRRTDIGEYRIIYCVDNDVLQIAAIGHRNDDKVYRDFERKL